MKLLLRRYFIAKQGTLFSCRAARMENGRKEKKDKGGKSETATVVCDSVVDCCFLHRGIESRDTQTQEKREGELRGKRE